MVSKEVASSKIDIQSSVSKPFTPEGKCEHEDYHDHAIPLNQMAQKIPSLLELELPPSSTGNLSIWLYLIALYQNLKICMQCRDKGESV